MQREVMKGFRDGSVESGNPVLVASRCSSCKSVFFPKKRVCEKCFSLDRMDEIPLAKRGTLKDYSVSYKGPSGFTTPFVIGWVHLPEGVNLLAQIVECEPFEERLRTNMQVELTTGIVSRDAAAGVETIGYQFKPVTREERP